jgi:hypothetical protein
MLSSRVSAVFMILVVVFGLLVLETDSAFATSGPPVTFSPGTGPLGSTLLTPTQFAVLPPEIQTFMSSHHVGDTWTVTINAVIDPSQPVFPPPGPQEFYGWTNASACTTSQNCDAYSIRIDVGYAGLGWWTRATSGAVANRTSASGITVTQIDHELRHHWLSNSPLWPRAADFALTYTQIYTPGDINTWSKSAETAGQFAYVGWFDWSFEDIPGIGPVLLPNSAPGYYATFIASQQSQVTDSAGGLTNLCFSQHMETLSWTSSAAYCSYPTNPLP